MNLSEKKYESGQEKEWEAFCGTSPDAWFWHTSGWLEYTLNYRPELKSKSISFWIFDEKRPVAVVPLTKETREDGKTEFSFGGAAIPAPALAPGLSTEEREIISDLIFKLIDGRAQSEQVVRATFRLSPLAPSSRELLSQGLFLQKYGYLDVSLETLMIDLHLSKDELWSQMRRNHHRNIEKGEEYKMIFYNSKNITAEIFDEYKEVHHKAAGRQTRPDRTFELMYEWLKNNLAFLVAVQLNGRNIAYEYYSVYKNSVYGFSAANDPDFEDLPIRHSLEWKAILWMKERGVDLYEIGIQHKGLLPHDPPDQKLMSISHFKKGFGGFSAPQYIGEKYYDREFFLNTQKDRAEHFALSLQ